MKRILLAVDESPASRRAAAFVDEFFAGQDVSLVALNVARIPVHWMPVVPYGGVTAWPWGPGDRAGLAEALEEEAAKAEAVATTQAPRDAHVEVAFGDPVETIIQAAEDEKADLVVVGSNDKGFLDRLFSGSGSERLTRESPRPVLVVP